MPLPRPTTESSYRLSPGLVVAAVGLATVQCTIPTLAQAPPPGFEPCASARAPASCGSIDVPEDPTGPGRSIELRVKILHGSRPDVGPPVFFLAGGPGQAVHDLEPMIVQRYGTLLAERDFVLIDQRGTGGSNPLACRTGALNDPERLFGPHYTEEELASCLEELSSRADVRLYTTPNFAEDLVAAADSLGFDRFDLVGGSYGTKAALVLMRAHPDRVGVAVLEGVAPPSFLNPLPHARGNKVVMDELLRRCSAEPSCNQAYPGLVRRFPALLERLDRAPAAVPMGDSGETIPLERGAMAYLTHILLFSAQSATLVPRLIHEVDQGEYALLTDLYEQIVTSLVSGIYFGLQLSVTCTENLPQFTSVDLEGVTHGTYLGRAMVEGIVEECGHWPTGSVPAGFYEPVEAAVPTLLVTGGLDPATPPAFGEEVDRDLPRSRLVRIDEGAHITAHPCVDGIVATFIRSRSLESLDTGCVSTITRPPFQIVG